MKIIKLSAIDSTNSFLKKLAQNNSLKNGTTVLAEKQLQGRGQMGTHWISEPNKNLLCSVFYSFKELLITDQFYLNYAISLAVIATLQEFKVPNLKIKWPNDIMSDTKKVCGILVENVIQNKYIQSTIIGIGLNVNQEVFSEDLPNASSLKKILGKEIEIDTVLTIFLEKLKVNFQLLNEENKTHLKEKYLTLLYKKNIPTMFRNNNQNVLFMGKIIGVTSLGKLQIELDDDRIEEFGIKEVSLAIL